MNNIWILAAAESNAPAGGITSETVKSGQTSTSTIASEPNAAAQKPQAKQNWTSFLPLILIFVVMWLLLFRGPQKQQQKKKKMMETLEKNDKVQTIGGIIGTIVDIKDDEVVLKVDESNNTKIRVSANAIGRNISKE